MTNAQHVLEREKSGYLRLPAPCPYFGTCGGCALQDLEYGDQQAIKQGRLQRALSPLGPMPPLELVGMREPWRYRNKAEFTFGEADGRMVLGYHAARSFWRVVDLDDCLLLPDAAMPIVRSALALCAGTSLRAYQPRTHQGFFRYALLRHSQATGQTLLCLITAPGPREVVEEIGRALRMRHPTLTSFSWGVTDRLADVARPETLIVLEGTRDFEERVGPFRLRVPPWSFLQPSTPLAHEMYAWITQTLLLPPQAVVWDLYCGLGVIGFYLARAAGRVFGIDVEPSHLEVAQANAAANGITNLEFRLGRVETLLLDRRFWLQEARPDAVVVDPPRAGLHPDALASILAARPPFLVYLSCNVHALTRDLSVLLSSFPRYRVIALRAFDLFPQTNHVEVCAILQREQTHGR